MARFPQTMEGISPGKRVRLIKFPDLDMLDQVFVVMDVLPQRSREDERLYEISNGVDSLDVYADEIELWEY